MLNANFYVSQKVNQKFKTKSKVSHPKLYFSILIDFNNLFFKLSLLSQQNNQKL